AQVDIERADWATADYDPSRGAVVGDRVDNLARVLQASVDDFDRRHDIFSGAQDLGKADARTAQRFAENERQFDLDARQTIIFVRNAGAVGDHHAVEEMPIIRLVDLRGALHRLRRQADFVPDQLGAGDNLAFG